MTDFYKLAESRYSVRKFKSNMIPDDVINTILEAGRLAPTAKNLQPQRIFVLKSSEAIAKANELSPCIYGAPVVIAIGYDDNEEWKSAISQKMHGGVTDTSIVLTHIMLQAAELGVGSCWVGMFNPDEASKALNLPDNIVLTALMPLGYPADDCSPSDRHSSRKPVNDTVKFL